MLAMHRSLTLTLVAVVCQNAAVFSQSPVTSNTLKLDQKQNMPHASVADIAWLAGSWTSEAFGGVGEEIWSSPSANTMVGMYRLIKDGKVLFYELCIIAPEGDSLVLKLKHFHPDLRGWEAKDAAVE